MSDRETRRLPRNRSAARGPGGRRTWSRWRGCCAGGRCRQGEILWQQGDDARELLFIVDGAVSASLRLSGDRAVEIWRAGRGETVGEIALLDGKGHTMSVRVAETAHGARARPGRLRRAARPPGSLGVPAEARPRAALHLAPPQPAAAPRRLARRASRTAREPTMPPGRSPSSSRAARPTASTCAAWRRSTTSTRSRSGGS